jgi:RNA polymerase sigma-32 factor
MKSLHSNPCLPEYAGQRPGNSLKALPAARESLQAYLDRIRKFPLLTAEQNNALAVCYKKNGDEQSACSLATSNLRLVVKIALSYQRKWVFDLMDIIQEGNVGLVQAIKKYDPFRGVKFSFYAAYWIKAYILKYIIDNMRLVKIGTNRTERMLFYNLRKEKSRLEKMGFQPAAESLALSLDTSSSKIIEMEQRLDGNEISLDAWQADGPGGPRFFSPGSGQALFDDALAEQELFGLALQKLEIFKTSLDPRRRDIFSARILSDNPATLKTIGKRHGITKERVRQIEKRLKSDARLLLQEAYPELRQQSARPALLMQDELACA